MFPFITLQHPVNFSSPLFTSLNNIRSLSSASSSIQFNRTNETSQHSVSIPFFSPHYIRISIRVLLSRCFVSMELLLLFNERTFLEDDLDRGSATPSVTKHSYFLRLSSGHRSLLTDSERRWKHYLFDHVPSERSRGGERAISASVNEEKRREERRYLPWKSKEKRGESLFLHLI